MKFLVLDDMLERHNFFSLLFRGHSVVHCFNFEDFIKVDFFDVDVFCLDHDLDDETWDTTKRGKGDLSPLPITNRGSRTVSYGWGGLANSSHTGLDACRRLVHCLYMKPKNTAQFLIHSQSSKENVDAMQRELEKSFVGRIVRLPFSELPDNLNQFKEMFYPHLETFKDE